MFLAKRLTCLLVLFHSECLQNPRRPMSYGVHEECCRHDPNWIVFQCEVQPLVETLSRSASSKTNRRRRWYSLNLSTFRLTTKNLHVDKVACYCRVEEKRFFQTFQPLKI